MDFNSITAVESCYKFISENQSQVTLEYYAHLPAVIISLIIGFFVFFKNRRALVNKLLFAISISFSIWAFLDLILWISFDSRLIMFAWALLGIFNLSIYITSLYFIYAFIDKRDISFIKKAILFLIILPIIVLTSTKFNLAFFDSPNCQATEWPYFSDYYYVLGFLISIWILIIAILRYRKAKEGIRKQIVLLTLGIELFLLSFFVTGFLNSYLVNIGYITDVVSYRIEMYGLFGMTIFMGFIAYLIVKFKAFNIKMLAAHALVITLVILIGSEFAFISLDNTTNVILISVTLLLAVIFGIMLINSVSNEVKRKEELQVMSNKLAIANDQLRKLDNAKSEFISIASHQLRTPLTAIKGFMSLLLEDSYGKVPVDQRIVLDKVYQSNERMVDLVEDLLNLSRIESGRMEYEFAPLKMEALCQEIFDTFVIRAKENKLYLDLKLPAIPLPEVVTDKNKIREIISNLVDNALKYTPKGGVTIKLTGDGEKVQVAVSDTGIGVPKDEIPYLFAKFSRGKDTTRLNTTGTGLGLHVGKRMMEELKGRIWVESEGTNKGSTFFVELPVKHAEAK